MNQNTPRDVPSGRTLHTDTTRHLPRLKIDLDDIRDRYFRMLATTDYAQRWDARFDLSFDVYSLVWEVDRLYVLLCEARRRLADLQAAAQATLAADHDGERDPLGYLRDELEHLTMVGLPDFPHPHPDDYDQDDSGDQEDGRDRPGDGPDRAAGPVGDGR